MVFTESGINITVVRPLKTDWSGHLPTDCSMLSGRVRPNSLQLRTSVPSANYRLFIIIVSFLSLGKFLVPSYQVDSYAQHYIICNSPL